MKKTIGIIIVDMQEFFLNNISKQVQDELIKNQQNIIDIGINKDLQFILLEFKAGGELRGSTISKLSNKIKNHVKEVIIKDNNGGFTKTNLDSILKELNIKEIILMGLNANGCIQDTAIGAINRKYKVITSKGIIASSYRNNLTLSKRNEAWFRNNTLFFDNPKKLVEYLESK